MPTTCDPTTGEPIHEYAEHEDIEVEARLRRAQEAYTSWSRSPLGTRLEALLGTGRLLLRGLDDHASRITKETGKPIRQSRDEIRKCADALEWMAGNAAAALGGAEGLRGGEGGAEATPEPLGPILGIMPWNFPYWQVVRFAGPALAAGNTVLVKHSDTTTGCLLALEEVFGRTCGHAFQALVVSADRMKGVIQDPLVRGVSLTGSRRTGRKVAAQAGEALKPTVMELGGSDAFIVLEDAADGVAEAAAEARLTNSGQSCIAAKRFLVHEDLHDGFLAAFVAAMAAHPPGDPRLESTTVGPMARGDLRDALHRQVRDSVRLGAEVALGGEAPPGPGYWYPPTVMTGVRPGMPVWDEEVFGPVAPVVPFCDDDEAVRLANASEYGLGASVWGNRAHARRVADRLHVGTAVVNAPVRSHWELPFGGVKDSGWGHELGHEGFRAFVHHRVVRVARRRVAAPAE